MTEQEIKAREKRKKKKKKYSPRPAVAHVPGLHQIIRKPDLPGYVGLRRSSIESLIAEGSFPRPIPLGGRSVGWLASELRQWQEARIAERDAGSPIRPGLAGTAAEHYRRRNFAKRVSLSE
jgi:prophage regulatory protein